MRFTPAARRRMLRYMSQVQTATYGVPVFVTLTYHNDWEVRDHKRDLQTYLKRVRRMVDGIEFVWRLEAQRRGAPHFHIIFWPPIGVDLDAKAVARAWSELLDPYKLDRHFWKHGAVAKVCDSFRMVMAYVSKYAGKVQEIAFFGIKTGHFWGHSRALRAGALSTLHVTDAEEITLRRIVRRYLKSKNAGRYARTVKVGHSSHVFAPARMWFDLVDFLRGSTPAAGVPPVRGGHTEGGPGREAPARLQA